MEKIRRYIMLIRVGTSIPTVDRVREAAPKIQKYLKEISDNDFQLILTTPDGSTMGFFLKTERDARWMLNDLYSLNNTGKDVSTLRNDDSLLITEVGDDFTGMGFSKAWNWLQHS